MACNSYILTLDSEPSSCVQISLVPAYQMLWVGRNQATFKSTTVRNFVTATISACEKFCEGKWTSCYDCVQIDCRHCNVITEEWSRWTFSQLNLQSCSQLINDLYTNPPVGTQLKDPDESLAIYRKISLVWVSCRVNTPLVTRNSLCTTSSFIRTHM